MLKHTLSCSTARFRMVVKASGTGVYMQMNEYGTDLDGYEGLLNSEGLPLLFQYSTFSHGSECYSNES